MNKLTIVLLADSSSHENLGRVLHAMQYAKQARQEGMEAEIIFDGGGVEWPAKLADEDHKLHEMYSQMKEQDIIKGVCEFCADAFDVSDKLDKNGETFLDEDEGHPNIGKKIAQEDRRVITL